MMTNSAIEQTQEIIAYIAEVLMVPETAQRWKERLKAELQKLSYMPSRIPLTEEEPWRSKGIHRLVIENFLLYFWIDEDTQTSLDGEILSGEIKANKLRMVLVWMDIHHEDLLANWSLLSAGERHFSIDPLR